MDQKICPTCGTEYPLSERFCPRDGTALRSASAQADLLGSIIADRYHILKKLGEGGMGTVYLAEHVKMGRKSALKVMNPGMNTDADAIARFNREASNASRLSHPNICGIYDFGETSDGLIYLAMEFIEGSSLTGLIEKTGAMPAARCGSIIHQTADALQVAHDAGIVHRDLKPDNIMIARNRDGSDLVKVVDFGIAKASSSDAQKVTKTGLVVGTPEYMSPEQLAGDKLDGRSDIYSLGLVAFNCLTGKLPFPAETVQEAMIMRLTDQPRTLAQTSPHLQWPAELQRTLDKALQRDANERYASAAQFGREFAAAISAMPTTQAVEAGTLVMGAAAAAAAVPNAADVPATRVHRASGKTLPMEAVPAPKPAAAPRSAPAREAAPEKSKVPMFAGIGVVVAAAAVGAFMFLNKPASPEGNSGNANPAGTAANTQTTPNPAPGPESSRVAQVPPPGTQTQPQDPPAGSAKSNAPVTPYNNPSTTPAPVPSNPPANTPVTDETETDMEKVARRLSAIRDSLESQSMSEAGARDVIRRMQGFRRNRRMIPRAIADTWYVEMLAHAQLDDDPEVCRAGKRVLELSQVPQARAAATQFMQGRECTP